MKKMILTSALALAISVGAAVPAHASDVEGRDFLIWQSHTNPIAILIGLLLPAIQSGRG